MCDNDIQDDQNDVECDDERVALANLIANLKLDVDENKKIQKQLKKANATLTQELTECKSILAETSRTLGESNSIRDSCLVALQNKQNEIERFKAFNDRTVDYDKLERREETLTLEKESQSKLNKDLVKPFDYTKLNSLYEIFKAPSLEYLYQLERAKEVRKTMWRKPFVRTKPNIAKNVAFLPVSKSISKSRQVFNDMTFNINQFREIVDQAWFKHTSDYFRVPTAKDMEVLIKTLLMPLSIKTQNDSFRFEHELKTEMHEDYEYVKSLEKEVDELESEKADFSNIYDLLLEEFKEYECLAQKLSKQIESVNKEVHNKLLKSFAKLENHLISLELALQKLNYTTSVSRPHLKCYQVKDKVVPNNSQVKFKKKEVEDHHRISSISKKTKSVTTCNDNLKSRTLNVNDVCAEYGKCVFNSNHDACVSRYLNDVNARTKKPNVVPISASKPKRKINKLVATPHKKTVASDTTVQKSKSYYKELYENTNQEWK
ncbi:hypothetical protein Tco_0823482 [Tanacetum coccineum]|uniref:Uncharacterized protein n=1 Tax=Tanacetum coccineum TaxID=301880 RepID=A0ABQ5AME2_9ASTR